MPVGWTFQKVPKVALLRQLFKSYAYISFSPTLTKSINKSGQIASILQIRTYSLGKERKSQNWPLLFAVHSSVLCDLSPGRTHTRGPFLQTGVECSQLSFDLSFSDFLSHMQFWYKKRSEKNKVAAKTNCTSLRRLYQYLGDLFNYALNVCTVVFVSFHCEVVSILLF